MMDPKDNRFDYGLHLQPPTGYELDCAIATTYSLDLDTLLAIPVAMYFHDTLEGDLRGEKLALLEAVSQLKYKIKIFYQAGNINLPSSYNRLFTLLEPWLQPVIPNGGEYSSFHPKLWLLRFTAEGNPVAHYRLLVLSRNLTFDRSWDIAVALDGAVNTKIKPISPEPSWLRFIRQLLASSQPLDSAAQLLAELTYIEWAAPANFKDPQLIVGGKEFGRPLQLDTDQDQLLVVSPFLSKQALDDLAKTAPDDKRWLFSRAAELNIIGAEALNKWQCYSINERIVDGEERLALGEQVGGQLQIRRHDLHAKIIVTQSKKTSHWHLGSANATDAALGKCRDTAPRNTEFMLRLTGTADKVGPAQLIAQWVDEDDTGLFVRHEFSSIESTEDGQLERQVRQLSHQLIAAAWNMNAEADEQDIFTLLLSNEEKIPVPESLRVEVGLLAIANTYQSLASEMSWPSVNVTQISALIPMIILTKDGITVEQLVIQVALTLPKGIDRAQLIFKQLIDSDDKFFNYIRLLLQQQSDKQQWLSYDNSTKSSHGLSCLFDESPVFEQLMEAAAKHPASLKRIQKLLERIKSSDVAIPVSFTQLWAHFEKVIG